MDSTAKFLVTTGVPVLLVIWARYVFQTVAVFFILLAHMRSLAFLKSRRPWLQFFRACALFGATMMFYNALKYIPLADGTAVVFLAPVMVTVLSGLFLGEHIDRHRWMAVAIAFAGVMVVVRPGSGILGYHALLPLGTALLTAIYFVMTRVLGNQDQVTSTAFYSTAVGSAILSVFVVFSWSTPAPATWGLMLLTGALGALGHSLIIIAYRDREASALAPFSYVQVIAATFWGYLLFADIPDSWTLTGSAMIIGAGLYIWYRERNPLNAAT